MDEGSRRVFANLIAARTAHSIEEYTFRLFDVFAPTRWASGLFATDRETGLAVANAAIVLPRAGMEPGGRQAGSCGLLPLAWFWFVLEFTNGAGHTGLAPSRGAYFPSVTTSPLLVGASSDLGCRLASGQDDQPPRGES